MKKLLVLFLSFLVSIAYAQKPSYPQMENPLQGRSSIMLWETHVLPNDTLIDCYLTYKIALKNLVFIRDGNIYKGGYSLYLDVKQNGVVISRGNSEQDIEVGNYENTNSSDDFLEGIIKITLRKGDYTFSPSLNIFNTDNTIILEPFTFICEREFSNNIIRPLVVTDAKTECSNADSYFLVNNQNYIPFSPKKYHLILPVNDEDTDELQVTVKQGENTHEYSLIKNGNRLNASYRVCDNAIVFYLKEEIGSLSLFILPDVNLKLEEGIAELKVGYGNNKQTTFTYNVVWLDKPVSLQDVEYATKLLRNIVSEEVVDSILDKSSNEMYGVLWDFWKNKDPNKSTSFNELMAEFYNRADYANTHFSTVDKLGTALDRGKIYIKLGPPSDIERLYYDKGDVVEIWRYDNIKKDFYFSDKSGLGNFTLMN